MSTSAVITCVSQMSQGTAATQRIGLKVSPRSIRLKGHISMDESAFGDVTNVIRLMLIWDREFNGGLPALTDILENTGQPEYSMPKWNTRRRFKILWDKTIWLGSAAAWGGSSVYTSITNKFAQNIDVYKKLHRMGTSFFQGSSNTNADAYNGQLLFVYLSDSSAIPHPDIWMQFRYRYTDL